MRRIVNEIGTAVYRINERIAEIEMEGYNPQIIVMGRAVMHDLISMDDLSYMGFKDGKEYYGIPIIVSRAIKDNQFAIY